MTERTGGVSLLIEEVTRLLLKRGEQGGIQAIPPTLQQSLMTLGKSALVATDQLIEGGANLFGRGRLE